jgi:hypothetical protein
MRLNGTLIRSGWRAEENNLDPTGTRNLTLRSSRHQPAALPAVVLKCVVQTNYLKQVITPKSTSYCVTALCWMVDVYRRRNICSIFGVEYQAELAYGTARSSEISLKLYQTTQRHILEDSIYHNHNRDTSCTSVIIRLTKCPSSNEHTLLRVSKLWPSSMVLTFSLKHDVWGNGFCLRLQVEPTQVGPIERASLRSGDRWIMSRIVIVILIYRRHKLIDSINLLGS